MKYLIFIWTLLLISCHGDVVKSEFGWSEVYNVGEISSKGCCRKHDRFDVATDHDKYYRTMYYRDIIQNYDEDDFVDFDTGDQIQFRLRIDSFEDGYSWNTIVGFKKVSK